MFGIMERAKNQLNIEDYSIGQTSLEQVRYKDHLVGRMFSTSD